MEKLSKLEAAARQLRQAIHLFLSEGDMVSVHTLAAASLQVLSDLGVRRGLVSTIKNPDLIRPDKRKFVSDLVNAPQNFFKHADRDPDEVLDFYDEATPFYIIDAVLLHQQLTGANVAACQAFRVWFMLNYPDVLIEGPVKDHVAGLVMGDRGMKEKALAHKLLLHMERKGV